MPIKININSEKWFTVERKKYLIKLIIRDWRIWYSWHRTKDIEIREWIQDKRNKI